MYYGYVHSDVLKVFPYINPRTLISWNERGLITPDVSNSSGRGSSRIYSYLNLIQIGIAHEFLRFGIPFSVIGSIMTGEAIMKLREGNDFDVVIWTYQQTPLAKSTPQRSHARLRSSDASSIRVPLPVVTAHGSQVRPAQCVKIDDFLADGGRIILGQPADDVSSILVVNVQGIKLFVDGQLRSLK